MPRMTVAIQGERGAFSHEAAQELAGPDIQVMPCPTFDALFAAAVSYSVYQLMFDVQ